MAHSSITRDKITGLYPGHHDYYILVFYDGGEKVRTATTMADITENLRTGGAPSLTESTATPNTHTVDPSSGAPKLNALKEFDGQPINYEDWEQGFKSTMGQTAYATLITTPPTTSDNIMETRDKELFFMLTKSLMKGSGMHIINAMNDESGHQAIQDMETWNGSAATSRTIIDHYRSRLEGLRLTEETTAFCPQPPSNSLSALSLGAPLLGSTVCVFGVAVLSVRLGAPPVRKFLVMSAIVVAVLTVSPPS